MRELIGWALVALVVVALALWMASALAEMVAAPAILVLS